MRGKAYHYGTVVGKTIGSGMNGKPKKGAREKDLTGRYLAGRLDEDRVQTHQRFSHREANFQKDRMLRTVSMRAEEAILSDVAKLPIGKVVQVFSLFCHVEYEGKRILCVVRKTLASARVSAMVVGDMVRFLHVAGEEAAVIEEILPRKTVLTRSQSHNVSDQQPVVANAEQMLIVVSIAQPAVKWGLVDRMIISAQSGGLKPIVCLNKIDLVETDPRAAQIMDFAREALAHYATLGVVTLQTSAIRNVGLERLREYLGGRTTVLAGHSGVGKSSLIGAVQPGLNLRVGANNAHTGKGRHTTTSANFYPLGFGGAVVDTPGIRQFGLWGVTRENLEQYFPDLQNNAGPPWRRESFQRIAASLGQADKSYGP